MKDWTYTHPHDPKRLTMHDCLVTSIELETNGDETRMIWYLPDGIWISPAVAGDGIQKTCHTHEACAVFSGKHLRGDDLAVSICKKSRWHGKDKQLLTETRLCMTLDEFVEAFRAEDRSMEIVNTYTEDFLFLIEGELRTSKKRESVTLSFSAESANYYWSTIDPDRVW